MQGEGVICYKFKSELKSHIIKFGGDQISVGQLKAQIEESRMR